MSLTEDSWPGSSVSWQSGCSGLPGLFVSLFEAPAAAFLGGGESSLFLRRFRDDLRDRHRAAVAVDGNEGEVAGVRVAAATGDHVLSFDADADLHRGAAGEVDARLHDDQVPDVDRLAEIDTVDRDGDA